MGTQFAIQSSDPALLEKATQAAEAFAQQYTRIGIVGITFLGALARGYFDSYADIDVIMFQSPDAAVPPPDRYIHEQGFEIHTSLTSYAEEVQQPWEMAKRWAFSSHRIVYDPDGLIEKLFNEKIPLRPAERSWLMIEGMTQSEWYINTLPCMWVTRQPSLTSASHV